MTARRLRTPAAVLLVFLALAAWLGTRALAARQHLEQARASLTSARSALQDQRVDEARTAIDAATRDTSRARALTRDPVWRVAAAVPLAGASLKATSKVAGAVDEIAQGALPPALQAAESLTGSGLRRPDGSVDLSVINRASTPVTAGARSLAAARAQLADAPQHGVAGAVRDAQTQLRSQLDELSSALDGAEQALAVAPALLGADRPRDYFVLVQQPGESRGTGGIPGGFAVLHADQGRFTVTAKGSNRDLEQGTIPLPQGVGEDFREQYEGNRGLELWQNVNLSPDLPVVARVVAARWKKQSGQQVDGVITMDPISISQLLRGFGPVDIGGRRVAPQDLVRFLTVDQYAGLPANADQSQRKDVLSTALGATADRLTSGGGSTQQLLRGAVEAVRSGHLRMASDDPALHDRLHAAGVDGALPEGPAPIAYAVVENETQGKLDSFLERSVTYTAGPCVGERRRSTITVELTNRAPQVGLPPYLTIRSDGESIRESTDSGVLLQVYGTAEATLVSAELDGAPLKTDPAADEEPLYEGLEAGLPFWQLDVDLPREQTRRLVLRVEEPVTAGPVRMPEQPLIRPLSTTVAGPVCG